MDGTILAYIVFIGVAWGFAGGLVAGWWAFRPAPFKPLPYAIVRAVRERRVVWAEPESN